MLLASGDDPPHEFLGRDRRGIRSDPGTVVDIDTKLDLRVAECVLSDQVADVAS